MTAPATSTSASSATAGRAGTATIPAPGSASENVPGESLPLWADAHTQPGGPHAEGLPRLTPYLLPAGAGEAPRPALLVFPGGGYGGRAAHEREPVARWANSVGLHAFVLDYRVAPDRHPLPLGDAQRAVRLVRHRAAEWGIDRQRIAVIGFSAGGHLAASLSTHWDGGESASDDAVERQGCRPDAAILSYPVISFLQFPHVGSLRNLLGDTPTLEQRRDLSSELQVTAQTPPTYLWHTAEDAAVPVENSLLYAAALARHGVPFALHVFPAGRHGIGLADGSPGTPALGEDAPTQLAGAWTGLCAAWLRATFGLTGPAQRA